jgi:predicted 3-demethylubiquinone-9 3-methyltransferase (glyoxalase superfamily)
MSKITPFLWFDKQAEEAAEFYVAIFKNSKVLGVSRYGKEGAKASGMKEGDIMMMVFELNGQDFMALNGGPAFNFTEAVSFMVDCKDQKEVDDFWEKLYKGGEKGQCGWLKDKYGLSWQIVPSILGELMQDEDKEKSARVMQAMLKMTKIDIKKLKEAYDEK